MKQSIINLLESAGFTELGKDQYAHPIHGRIFLKEDTQAIDLVDKLMYLGAQHQTNKIRESLMLDKQTECYIFNPQA